MELHKRMQMFREAKNITQQEMADACGLSKNYLSAMERGAHRPNAATLIAYADKLEMSLDELVGRSASDINILPGLTLTLAKFSEEDQETILKILNVLKP